MFCSQHVCCSRDTEIQSIVGCHAKTDDNIFIIAHTKQHILNFRLKVNM